MSDMNFGVNVLPTTTETYNLGSSTKKWDNVYTETLNGTDVDTLGTVHRYTATIPTTGWTTSNGTSTVTVSVSGIQASDTNGKLVLVYSGTSSTDEQRRADYALIKRVSAANNAIVVYATAVPTASIPVSMEVIR